jgi:hypothetical protein
MEFEVKASCKKNEKKKKELFAKHRFIDYKYGAVVLLPNSH